jgi:hypothetical protein
VGYHVPQRAQDGGILVVLGDDQVNLGGGRDSVRGLHVKRDLAGPVDLVGAGRVEGRLAIGVEDAEARTGKLEGAVLHAKVLGNRGVAESVDKHNGLPGTAQVLRDVVRGRELLRRVAVGRRTRLLASEQVAGTRGARAVLADVPVSQRGTGLRSHMTGHG